MKLKLKIFWRSSIPKIIGLSVLITTLILLLILPTFLYTRPKNSIIAYNRDATSGTRSAFAELVLEKDQFLPSKNVREVKGNEQMIQNVDKNLYSLGYVSLSTVAEFDGMNNLIIKNRNDKIPNYKLAALNNVVPTKNNLMNEKYSASRDFNMFFRVEKDSNEAKILDYDWINNSISTDVNLLSDNLKVSYLFYEWVINSKQSYNFLISEDEIPSGNESDKIDINSKYVETYFENVGLDSKNSNIKIEIVGSTSAINTINLLKKEFINEFENEFNNLEISIDTNGSGDAFNKNIPGISESYIGMQSRKFEENEISNWGWENSNVPYSSFAKDAIAIIYNAKKGVEQLSNNEYKNINSKEIQDLYSKNEYLFYDDIFNGEVIL